MKSQFVLIIFSLILFLSVSCKKDDKTSSSDAGEYLPLQMYNYWEIEHTGRISTVGTKLIDNKTYFVFVQESDTSYYRNENNKIFVRRSTGSESIKFDLTAEANKSWEFIDGGTIWSVSRISKTDTLTINNTKIPNCYQFVFDIPMTVDAAYSIWLAPGIGFIRTGCGFCPYPKRDLLKANINNQQITFP